MTSHSFVNLSDVPPVIDVSTQTEVRPAPTLEQEQVADNVFSPEQEHLAAAFIAMQLGVGLVHTLAAEADEALNEEEDPPPPPRKDPTP